MQDHVRGLFRNLFRLPSPLRSITFRKPFTLMSSIPMNRSTHTSTTIQYNSETSTPHNSPSKSALQPPTHSPHPTSSAPSN